MRCEEKVADSTERVDFKIFHDKGFGLTPLHTPVRGPSDLNEKPNIKLLLNFSNARIIDSNKPKNELFNFCCSRTKSILNLWQNS